MEKELKADYDYKNDTIYFYSLDEETKGSFNLDMFIFDISKKNEISGIEILNVSKLISSILKKKISKKELLKIDNAKIKYHAVNNLLFLTIEFNISNEYFNLPLSISNPQSVYS